MTNIDLMIIKPNLNKVKITNNRIDSKTFTNNLRLRFCFFLHILLIFLVFGFYILDLLFFNFYLLWRIYLIIMIDSNITKDDVKIDTRKMQIRFACTLFDWFQYIFYCYCLWYWSYGGIFHLYYYLHCTVVSFPIYGSCFCFCYSCCRHACQCWCCFLCLQLRCHFRCLRNLRFHLQMRLQLFLRTTPWFRGKCQRINKRRNIRGNRLRNQVWASKGFVTNTIRKRIQSSSTDCSKTIVVKSSGNRVQILDNTTKRVNEKFGRII